jgi:2-keto-myo-inositol isomerase
MSAVSKMIPCINQATVLPADTLEFVEEAKKAGFDLVEFDIVKLEEAVQKYGFSKLKEFVDGRQIRAVSLNAIENFPILTENEMTSSLARCEGIFKLSRDLGCEIVVVNPNEFEGEKEAETKKAFDSFVTRAAEMAGSFSVKLGYEFVSYENRVFNTLAESLRGLSRWGSEVGLVLDVFHLFRTGERLTQISDRMMDRVWVFHVNDAPQLPISGLRDSDRVFPGEGVVNVRATLEELRSRRFAGPVSLELFNASYWKRPTQEVLGKSWESVETLLQHLS